MGMLGQGQYVIDIIDNLNPREVIAKFDDLWANRGKAKETILTRIESLKQRSYRNAELASELLANKKKAMSGELENF